MTMYYSASTSGFYVDGIHTNMPDDCVMITAARHQTLLESQSQGMQIVADEAGLPIAVAPLPPSVEQLLPAMRQQRDQRLSASDKYMFPDYPISEDVRDAWRIYRQALRDLPETFTDPQSVDWPTPPNQEEV